MNTSHSADDPLKETSIVAKSSSASDAANCSDHDSPASRLNEPLDGSSVSRIGAKATFATVVSSDLISRANWN